MKNNHSIHSGQALIAFLFFVLMGITVTSAGIMMLLNTMTSTSIQERSVIAVAYAESGVENAILRLLRRIDYTGEVLTFDQGTVDVVVADGRITATAKANDITRIIQAITVYNNDTITVISWKEIF